MSSAPEHRRRLIWLGVFTILTLVAITYLALQVGGIDLGDRDRYRLVFQNATGIPDNADVRVAGIKVGSVQEMTLTEGRRAEVRIGVRPDIEVRDDARAVIKSKSLLGERFIELRPGETGELVPSGSTITDTVTPFRVEDLGEVLGPLVEGVEPRELERAVRGLVELIVHNRDDLVESAQALGETITRLNRLLDRNEEEFARLLASSSDLAVRLDRFVARNEKDLSDGVQNMGLLVEDVRRFTAELETLGGQFPAAATDAAELVGRLNRLAARVEGFDPAELLWIAKKVLQDEGVNINLLGYSDDAVEEHLEEYRTHYAETHSSPSTGP